MLKLQRAEDVIDWLAGGVKADDLSSAQQIRLANAFEITKQYQLALSYYEKLLKEEGKTVEHEQLRHADDEPAPPEMTFNREELLLAAARCAVNATCHLESNTLKFWFESLHANRTSCVSTQACCFSRGKSRTH